MSRIGFIDSLGSNVGAKNMSRTRRQRSIEGPPAICQRRRRGNFSNFCESTRLIRFGKMSPITYG